MKEKLNVDSEKTLEDTKISERIIHLRRLILVHSYLYYVLDDPRVPDDLWQQWANELATLQSTKEFEPKLVGFYDEVFRDWEGTTGHHLPFDDRWVISKALQIRRIHGQVQAG